MNMIIALVLGTIIGAVLGGPARHSVPDSVRKTASATSPSIWNVRSQARRPYSKHPVRMRYRSCKTR